MARFVVIQVLAIGLFIVAGLSDVYSAPTETSSTIGNVSETTTASSMTSNPIPTTANSSVELTDGSASSTATTVHHGDIIDISNRTVTHNHSNSSIDNLNPVNNGTQSETLESTSSQPNSTTPLSVIVLEQGNNLNNFVDLNTENPTIPNSSTQAPNMTIPASTRAPSSPNEATPVVNATTTAKSITGENSSRADTQISQVPIVTSTQAPSANETASDKSSPSESLSNGTTQMPEIRAPTTPQAPELSSGATTIANETAPSGNSSSVQFGFPSADTQTPEIPIPTTKAPSGESSSSANTQPGLVLTLLFAILAIKALF